MTICDVLSDAMAVVTVTGDSGDGGKSSGSIESRSSSNLFFFVSATKSGDVSSRLLLLGTLGVAVFTSLLIPYIWAVTVVKKSSAKGSPLKVPLSTHTKRD